MRSKAVSHCGAGCTLGDISAEWLVLAAGPTIAGRALCADFVLESVFARILGVVFQYFTSAPMRDVSRTEGGAGRHLVRPCLPGGLFFGMWVCQEVISSPGPSKTSAAHRMLTQVSMVRGFSPRGP